MQLRTLCLSIFLLSLPHAASANLNDAFCDDSSRLERQLSQVVGAMKLSRGMRSPDSIVEVWIEPQTGDWTLVQSYTNGTSCIVAMGQHWEDLRPDVASEKQQG